ncbi:MAG: hypothetical protein ACXV78_06110 [Candidatus Angelobacter sp.]
MLVDLINIGYSPLIWASDIAADVRKDRIVLGGKVPFSDSHLEPNRDVFLRYIRATQSKTKGEANRSPHIQFANANSDKELIAFVREFGPVVASHLEEHGPLSDVDSEEDQRETRIAVQDLSILRREQTLYKSALCLLSELYRGEKRARLRVIHNCAIAIVQGVSEWPRDWEMENQLRSKARQGTPAWHFDDNKSSTLAAWKFWIESEPQPLAGPGPFQAAHHMLCDLINAFPTEVEFIVDRPIETLPFDSIRYGLRPALYLILKYEYLKRGGIDICRNDSCYRFFVSERLNQQFCSEDCSRRYRQRQYWARTGAKRRKLRLKEQRSSSEKIKRRK